jgi:predicted dehydrogenase
VVELLEGSLLNAGDNMQHVKVGIIGTGLISQFHGLAYNRLAEKAKIEAVCDTNIGLAKQRAREWGVSKVYDDYQKLLEDKEIEAVEILLPHTLHKAVVLSALENNKHVSVQKPMALTIEDAHEMVKAARKAGMILNVAENYLFHEHVTRAIEMIRSGELGEPLVVRVERVPGVGTLDKYREPRDPEYWRMSKEKSGGMVYDDMVHYDALARFLLQSDIESVTAMLHRPDLATEVPALVSWKHTIEPRYGNFAYSQRTRIKMQTDYYALHESVEVICQDGLLWITNLSSKITVEPPLRVYKNGKISEYQDLNTEYPNSFYREVDHFIDCVRTNREPIFNGEQGVKQVLFAAAIQKSADESRVIKLSQLDSS